MLFVRKSNKIFGFGYAAGRSSFTAGACTLPARLKILSAHLKTILLPVNVPYICIRIKEQSLHKQEVKFFSHIGFDWFLKCPATSNAGHFFVFTQLLDSQPNRVNSRSVFCVATIPLTVILNEIQLDALTGITYSTIPAVCRKLLVTHLKTTLLPFNVPYICIRIREQPLHKQEVKFFHILVLIGF